MFDKYKFKLYKYFIYYVMYDTYIYNSMETAE